MRNPNRLYKFYEELCRIHMEHCPDCRFGQMIMNVLGQMQSGGRDPFFPEEDEMLTYFKKYFHEEGDDGVAG